MLMIVLKDNCFPNNQWYNLGLRLGIIQPDLETIRVEERSSNGCLIRCLVRWLQQGYDTARYSLPTMESLVAALRGMGLNAVAEGITLHTQGIFICKIYVMYDIHNHVHSHTCITHIINPPQEIVYQILFFLHARVVCMQVLRLFWCLHYLSYYVCPHLKIIVHCIGRIHSLAITSSLTRKVSVVSIIKMADFK